MAFAGTEYEEVCGWSPACAAVVGDYIVAVNNRGTVPSGSTLPSSTHAIFNTATNTARIFSGLDNYNKLGHGAVGYDGKVWVCQDGSGLVGTPKFQSINPATGAVTDYDEYDANRAIVAAAGRIWFVSVTSLKAYEISSDTMGSPIGGYSNITGWAAANDDRIIIGHGTTSTPIQITAFNATTGAVIATTATPITASAAGRGAVIGSHVYFRTTGGLYRYNWSTYAIDFIPTTPTGFPGTDPLNATIAGPDGYIYGLSPTAPYQITVIDPATGSWQVDDAPTVRSRRLPMVLGPDGYLWVPTGEPLG